jgi:hypothetical protein
VSREGGWVWTWPEFAASVRVPGEVDALWRSHRQGGADPERGGQLFVDARDAQGLYLGCATPPHGRDRSGHHWLELDARRCRAELRAAERMGLQLLGYWHTHPEPVPHVSPQDTASFREFTRRNGSTLPYPVCVIVGQSAVRAWSIRESQVIEARYVG